MDDVRTVDIRDAVRDAQRQLLAERRVKRPQGGKVRRPTKMQDPLKWVDQRRVDLGIMSAQDYDKKYPLTEAEKSAPKAFRAPPRKTLSERVAAGAEDAFKHTGLAPTIGRVAASAVERADRSGLVEQGRVARKERDYRERQAMEEAVDPTLDGDDIGGSVGRFGAQALGSLIGGVDPTYLIAPGASAVPRILGQAGINAGVDAALQGMDIATDVQDEFDPLRTGINAAAGAAFQGAGEAARAFRELRADPRVDLPEDVVVREDVPEGNQTLASEPEIAKSVEAAPIQNKASVVPNPDNDVFTPGKSGWSKYEITVTGADGQPIAASVLIPDHRKGVGTIDIGGAQPNQLGPAQIRNLASQLANEIPELKALTGYRISGSRKASGNYGEDATVNIERLRRQPDASRSSNEQDFSSFVDELNLKNPVDTPKPRQGYTGSLGPSNEAVRDASEILEEGLDRGFRPREETIEAGRELGLTPENFAQEGAIGDISAVAARGSELASDTARNAILRLIEFGDGTPEYDAAVREFLSVAQQHSDNAGEIGRGLNILGKSKAGKPSLDETRALEDLFANPENSEKLARLIETYKNDPDAIRKIARDAVEPTLRDKIFSFRYNMMLSGPKTHVYNILGNTGNFLYDLGEHGMAALLGSRKMLAADTDRVTGREFASRIIGAAVGARRGLALAKTAFKEGRTADQVDRAEMRRGKVGRWEVPVRAIAAQDEFFRSVAQTSDIYGLSARKAFQEGKTGQELKDRINTLIDQTEFYSEEQARAFGRRIAKAEGLEGRAREARIKEIMEETPWAIRRDADDYAKRMRFQDDPSFLGQMIEQARVRNKKDTLLTKIGKDGLALVIPFVRTPDSLIRTALRRSPLGVLEGQNIKDFKAGGAKRDLAIARVAMGSGISAYIGMKVIEGVVTGQGPRDYKKRQVLEASGWKPNSIKIGDDYYSYEGLEPLSHVLSGTATIMERWNEGKSESYVDKAAANAVNLAEVFMNSAWAESLADVFGVLDAPEGQRKAALNNVVANIGSSFVVPAALRQVNTSYLDPVVRDTRGDDSMMDRVAGRIMTGVPGLSDNLPAQHDILGREITRGDALGPDILSRFYPNPADKSPIALEITRLMETDPEGRPSLRATDRSFDGVRLTAEEAQNYQMVTGAYIRDMMEQEMEAPDWNALPDDEKRDILDDVAKTARKMAREDLFSEPKDEPEAKGPSLIPEAAASDEGPELIEGEELEIEGFPFGYVTSMRRTQEGNREVGGKAGSRHLTGEGIDLKPSPGVTMEELADEAELFFGPGTKTLIEGDHVHVTVPELDAPYFGPRGTKGLK